MTDRPPKIENAPGLTWKRLKSGWLALWRARTDLVKRGFYPKNRRIMILAGEPSDFDRNFIADECRALQDEMLLWGRGGLAPVGGFDGTIAGLIICYQTDEDSNFRQLRYRTREGYATLCKALEGRHGAVLVRDTKARTLRRWHEEWTAGGKVAMAHAMMGMLRTVCTFGATILEDEDCRALKTLLHDMRFKMARPRNERMTAAQAVAVRAKAHERGFPSVALAQALQFELMLRQKDVIGEWVPISEPGTSDITNANEKWLRGLRWSEIDQTLILRHTTSKRGKDIEVDLKLAPMVMEELARYSDLPSSGPVVVHESTNRPYLAQTFRMKWRQIATEAGVPPTVFNMDSRAGGITEATDAGAALEHVRHAATHGDISMTQKYSRGSVEKVAEVMTLRVKHRNKGKHP